MRKLIRDQRGAGAVEFALCAPILITMIYGIFELGQLFEANASMQHALGEGARVATLCIPDANASTGCDVPDDSAIVSKMNSKLFGPKGGTFTVPTPTTSSGYKTLTVKYTRTLNFLLFAGPSVTLTRTKQVYTIS